MAVKRYEYDAKVRRTRRVRARIKESGRPRLSVFRSNRHIYAQVIDDRTGRTLAAASTLEPGVEGGCTKKGAENVGRLVAERALKAGVVEVAFDRGPYRYHGRVKALAEAARAAGLKF